MTVKEAIEYCIANGIESAKSQLDSYEKAKPNRLSTKNQIEALEKSLKCFYENVEITGGGKRGKVLLSGLKEEATEREDNRKGKSGIQPTEYDLLMDEFIFNHLSRIDIEETPPLPYKSWANKIGYFNLVEFQQQRVKLRPILNELHKKTIKFDKRTATSILNDFSETVQRRNNDVIKNAFRRLERAGRITTVDKYFAYTLSGKYKEISNFKADKIKMEEDEILEKYGLSRKSYIYKDNNENFQDDVFDKAKEEIEKHLSDNHRIRYYYKAIKVTEIIDTTIRHDVTAEQNLEAYYGRLIHLTINNKYNVGSIVKEWRIINTLTILKKLGVEVPEQVIAREQEKLIFFQENSFNSNNVGNLLWDMDYQLPENF